VASEVVGGMDTASVLSWKTPLCSTRCCSRRFPALSFGWGGSRGPVCGKLGSRSRRETALGALSEMARSGYYAGGRSQKWSLPQARAWKRSRLLGQPWEPADRTRGTLRASWALKKGSFSSRGEMLDVRDLTAGAVTP